MVFDPDTLSSDLFLGGKIRILQPKIGYRAGVDPVLLAASVPVVSGQSVLELGCGAGVASLCLAARVPGLALSGVELQDSYADLARQNAAANGQNMVVYQADLRKLPDALRQASFDHVIMNPPYYPSAHGTSAADGGRDLALREQIALADWLAVATRRLRPKGVLTVIQDARRLPELLGALDQRLGAVRVLPISARRNRPAGLVILQARKGSRADFQLLAPLLMHQGERHEKDGESYTPQIRQVLRHGAGLDLAAVHQK
ncbi:MAG: methyltransferase [Rhodobacterales bacterium]|nr:MAG: methyltransferase [Rhodobacterales bacterium]